MSGISGPELFSHVCGVGHTSSYPMLQCVCLWMFLLASCSFSFVATVFLFNMALRWQSLCLILRDLMEIGNPSCSSIRTLALHFLSLWNNALQWKWNAAHSTHSDYWKHEFNMTCTSYLIHPVERPVASHFVMHALMTSLPHLKNMLLQELLGIECGCLLYTSDAAD